MLQLYLKSMVNYMFSSLGPPAPVVLVKAGLHWPARNICPKPGLAAGQLCCWFSLCWAGHYTPPSQQTGCSLGSKLRAEFALGCCAEAGRAVALGVRPV